MAVPLLLAWVQVHADRNKDGIIPGKPDAELAVALTSLKVGVAS